MSALIIIVILLVLVGIVYAYFSHMHTQNIRREKVANLKELLRLLDVSRQNYIHANTLELCYEVYKDLIKYFLPYVQRCSSINADPYGIFRAPGDPFSPTYQDSLKNITEENIFLGNIYGLVTKPLSYWETCDDKEAKDLVWRQFYNYLHSGLTDIEHQIKKEINKTSGHTVYKL